MKRTREEMIAEFHRLYTIFETIEDCLHNQDGAYWTTGFGRLVRSRAAQLERVVKGEFPPGEIVLGTLQAINDTSAELVSQLRDDPAKAEQALAAYRERTGRDYWQDAKPPKALIKVILKRGRLLDEAEGRLLDGWLAEATGRGKPAEMTLAKDILARFREAAEPGRG
ncbi:MAG: hypothetical protein J0L64_07405 [Acidobacteria bacterium]|nr:hypothetical protein [Acidobacteriota bacterium]